MRSRLHALAIAAAVAVPHAASVVSQSLNPPYLSEMPSVERVKAEIKGSDPIDTSARQMGAFWQLMEIINTLAGPRFRSLEFTRDEDRVKGEYFGAWQRYQTTDLPSAQDDPRWRKLRAQYEKDTALREELLQRFFSAEFRTAYAQATGTRPVQTATQGRVNAANPPGAGPPPATPPSPSPSAQPSTPGGPSAEALIAQGKKYMQARNPIKAVEAYQQAIRIKPTTPEAHSELGWSFMWLEQFERAIATFREAVRLDPKTATHHGSLGRAYFLTGQYAQSAASYRQADRLKAQYEEYGYELGIALLMAGNKPAALRVHEAMSKGDDWTKTGATTLLEVINAPGGPAGVLVQYAMGQSKHGGGRQENWESHAALQLALRLKPTGVKILFDIGYLQAEFQQFEEALSTYRNIIAMKPGVEDLSSAYESYRESRRAN